jgi:hypothetical protein
MGCAGSSAAPINRKDRLRARGHFQMGAMKSPANMTDELSVIRIGALLREPW